MKKATFRFKALALAASCLLSIGTAWADVNPKPFVVPELTQWTGAEGTTTLSGRIILKNKKTQGVAAAWIKDYSTMMGKQLAGVVTGAPKEGDLVFNIKADKKLGAEGYTLSIGRHIELTAATEQGLFWGTRTLLQLLEQHTDGALPKGTTTDIPQFKVRGFMIDCGRKYIPISYLNNLAKIMAYYKMNTLQVHLNDNGFRQFFGNDWAKTPAAFRLESDYFPGLTAKDGSYTKQEFIDFQKVAEQNHVEVIPEIDAPAHVLAFTHYRPQLGSQKYGMDHFDLFNPEVYTFMDSLYNEYLKGPNPVFRGKRVHIGTDEYSNADKDVVEKFRSFTDHYIREVEKYGKQAMVWGALTHANGTTPVKSKNVIMNCWYNGYADPVEMKKQGYQLISVPDGLTYIVPAAGYYYDYLNTNYLYDSWTPNQIGNAHFEENDPAVLGGMFAVWNDHFGNGISTKDVHDRTYPALQTLAVKFWTGSKKQLPFAEFDKQRLQLSEAPGVNESGNLRRALHMSQTSETVAFNMDKVTPGAALDLTEVGYGYSVSFNIKAAAEQKGTELFRSPNAVFYLSDPKEGKLGFERDGYLNTFNYRLDQGKDVRLTIEGDNRSTRLLVNGEVREELNAIPLYVMRDQDRAHFQVAGASPYEPIVYRPTEKINYQRTLVFPLHKAGQFNSQVTNLKVTQK